MCFLLNISRSYLFFFNLSEYVSHLKSGPQTCLGSFSHFLRECFLSFFRPCKKPTMYQGQRLTTTLGSHILDLLLRKSREITSVCIKSNIYNQLFRVELCRSKHRVPLFLLLSFEGV